MNIQIQELHGYQGNYKLCSLKKRDFWGLYNTYFKYVKSAQLLEKLVKT